MVANLKEDNRFTNREYIVKTTAKATDELAIIFGILFSLGVIWYLTGQSIRITVDDMDVTIHTHRQTVAGLLPDLRLGQDAGQLSLSHQPQSALPPDQPLVIQRAHSWLVWLDDRELRLESWENTPLAILAQAGIQINDDDAVWFDNQDVAIDTPLPYPSLALAPLQQAIYIWQATTKKPRQLRVNQAVPITIDDGGQVFAMRMAAQNVGQVLQKSGIALQEGDRVEPALGSPLQTGLKIVIHRSVAVTIQVDGQLIQTGTLGRTVADALSEIGIVLADKDRVTPPLLDGIYENIQIQVTRIREDVESVDNVTPFETIFRPDPNVAIDTRQTVNPGADGIRRTRYRIRYEDGLEVFRTLEDSWQAQTPTPRIIAYGQRIVPQTVPGPGGKTITYWRKVRMLATSYSASTAGTSPDKSWYGRTYTGDKMRYGIVAVDPDVVPLRSKVYVPGYGYGDALDIGGSIVAKHIDLGYDDDNLVLWHKWVDVYLLWPPPSPDQITWVLRDWPKE